MQNTTRSTSLILLIFLLPITLLSGQYFVLCEGNYGQANASLWSIDESLTSAEGPLIWDIATDPLGDVGQSMTLFDHTLYLVMNNSHQIRIVDLESTPSHVADIDLAGSSPRYLAIHRESHLGYVSSWNLGALLVIDLDQNSVIDTLEMNALPEEILIDGDDMYVSVTMESDWSSNNEVWQYDLSLPTPEVVHVYTTIAGPGSMTLIGDQLYVTSIYYNDAWESFSGSARIDLTDHTVETLDHGYYQNFSADVAALGGRPYRSFGESIVPLNMDLSLDTANSLGSLPGIYAFAVANENLLISTSDFIAPDPVHILSSSGSELASLNVGALPGSMVFYDPDLVDIEPQAAHPQRHHLSQNFPNPFNPETTIPLFLPQSAVVHLAVFDIRGRQLVTLYSGDMMAGNHTMIWDGMGPGGEQLSSGIYYAIARIGPSSETVKMSLVR